MPEVVDFTINGERHRLTREQVVRVMCSQAPEEIRKHSVEVSGTQYPVKQVLAAATGVDRLDFTSALARRALSRLGFEPRREK